MAQSGQTGKPVTSGDPRRIGRYRLTERLGSGAMGHVYLAVDWNGGLAAVKVIRADLAERPEFRERFARESAVAGRVGGAHVARIIDADPEGPAPWLAAEYVPGPTLQAFVEQTGPLDAARVRWLAASLAAALRDIHAAGVVHRDLKPSNVLLGPNGPMVIDFGAAREAGVALTAHGTTIGTPAYMSPEQVEGCPVEPAGDVFALGALLAFAATGRLAFGDGSQQEVLERVVHGAPDLDGVGPQMIGLIEACLGKDPATRPTPDQIIEACRAPLPTGVVVIGGEEPDGAPATVYVGPESVAEFLDSQPIDTQASHARPIPAPRPSKRTYVAASAAVVLVAAGVATLSDAGLGRPDAATGAVPTSFEQNAAGAPSADDGSLPTGKLGTPTATGAQPTAPSAPSKASVSTPKAHSAKTYPGGTMAGRPKTSRPPSAAPPVTVPSDPSDDDDQGGSPTGPATPSWPIPPSLLPDVPGNFAFSTTAIGGRAPTLDFVWTEFAVTSYFDLEVNGVVTQVPGNVGQFTLPGAKAGHLYCARIRAVNWFGVSGWSQLDCQTA